MSETAYDIGIVGGGIAGLSLAIQCANAGFKTVVFEKDEYPRHKVCGEYISNESRDFLKHLGIDINAIGLPEINTFRMTDVYGNISSCSLDPGGFGWSRYAFDHALYQRAIEAGATVKTKCKVTKTSGDYSAGFTVETSSGSAIECRMFVNASGRMAASRLSQQTGDQWIGVKYHLAAGPSEDTIEIHAFEDGYAGVSKIENNKYCLAYLCKANGLKSAGGDIKKYESEVLHKNKALQKRLAAAIEMGPITTSQFYFGMSNGSYVTLGDASGFIPPLTGNGMSLALRSSKNTFQHLNQLLNNEISESKFHKNCEEYLKGYLSKRVKRGIVLQRLLFLKPEPLNRLMMKSFSIAPFALKTMSKLAVGDTI